MSQLALASEADISARHLCFLDTGRAQPSREMVLEQLRIECFYPADRATEKAAQRLAAAAAPPRGVRARA
jgi:hypothetical protein